MRLAKTMPGYVHFESARNEDGFGIGVSYWESEEAIKNWRDNVEHKTARDKGRDDWYKDYTIYITKIEHSYSWERKK